jgi:glucose-6-phosphate isomerase
MDLSELSGLPIELDENGLLVFGPGVVVSEHGERPLSALAPVVLEPEYVEDTDEVAYYMDNGVYLQEDADTLAGISMRYELTLIPPRRVGTEYIKTFGHRHHPDAASGVDPAEICEVLVGTAHFLFQTLDPAGPSASAVYYVEATAGQKVVFPPGFDHCTINPGTEPVLFSDVVALGISGNYDRFTEARGAAYVEVCENGGPQFVPNPTYAEVAPLQRLELREYPELSLTTDEPLYTAFVRTRAAQWGFLGDPTLFWPTFPDLKAAFGA